MQVLPQDAAHIPARLNEQALERGWPFHCDPGLVFKTPQLSAITDLWESKSRDGQAPPRSAFDMRALQPFIRNVAILERIIDAKGQRYRFRLFGTALCDLFGEHTGRDLDDTVPPALLASWNACYDSAIEYGAPLRFINYYRIPTLDYLKGETFVAPLAAEGTNGPMILTATYVSLKDAALAPKF